MRARIGILIVLTVAALAVFEATSPAEKRLLFPAPASEPAPAVEPMLYEIAPDAAILPADDLDAHPALFSPAQPLEGMPGSGWQDPWSGTDGWRGEEGRAHAS